MFDNMNMKALENIKNLNCKNLNCNKSAATKTYMNATPKG